MVFDPATETARYIDSLGPEALERAASYTSNSHWMILWGLIASFVVTWLIVRWGIIEKIAARLTARGWAVRTTLTCAAFFVISAVISLPWTIYQDWGFERSYGRTSQPLADFLVQSVIGIAISSLFAALFFLGIYALIRRAAKRWWLWSGGLAAFAVSLILLLSPIVTEPIFNDYKPVPEGPVRDALVKMADEAGIQQDRLFMFDGSRQSNNFTANVSGILGTGRIAISDVALKEASLDEVKAVTGHEIGHYMSGHVWRAVVALAGLAIVGFFLIDKLFPFFARIFGSKATLDMPEGLPVLTFMFGLFALLGQPLMNAISRQGEREADNYSLCTVNLPDALAEALIKTAEYRYPRPSAVQEVLFYTHPSVEWRVRNAMNWKAKPWPCEHL